MDPIAGLSSLGLDFKDLIVVVISCLILIRLAKVALKGSGAAAIGFTIGVVGLIYYMANGGGIADVGSIIKSLVHTHLMGQPK